MTGPKAPGGSVGCDAHASDRHTCEVQTTCQPPSSWCKDPWPATIRAISSSGLSLALARRFERGAGLAIELPTDEAGMATVLARVRQVNENPAGGWMLACDFISALSDEEVQRVLRLDPRHQNLPGPPATARPPAFVKGVLFHANVYTGELLRWFVKHLDLSSGWPLTSGQTVIFRVGDLPPEASLRLKIDSCKLIGSYWFVGCRLRNVPPDDVLRALTFPNG